MKFSSKVQKCGLSPMRKFHPYAVAAEAKGRKIYHLNIGQPDVITPPAFFEAIRSFEQPVLAYAPSPGIPELIDAIQGYYDALNMHFDKSEILVTTGGSEALAIALQCILDDGDEILIPEPFYPNYNTMVRTCGASIRPIPTSPEEGYHYAERSKIEPRPRRGSFPSGRKTERGGRRRFPAAGCARRRRRRRPRRSPRSVLFSPGSPNPALPARDPAGKSTRPRCGRRGSPKGVSRSTPPAPRRTSRPYRKRRGRGAAADDRRRDRKTARRPRAPAPAGR